MCDVYLDKEMQKHDVLLVLTDDKIGLSGPISFNTIRLQSRPLLRLDVATDDANGGIDIFQVSLRTAVRFITELQLGE